MPRRYHLRWFALPPRHAAFVILAFSIGAPPSAGAAPYCESYTRNGQWTIIAEADYFSLYYPAHYPMSDHPYLKLERRGGNEVWEFHSSYSVDPLPVVDVEIEDEETGETKTAAIRDADGNDYINVPLAELGFPMGLGRQRITMSVNGGELASLVVDFGNFGDAYRRGRKFADSEGARKRAGKCKGMDGDWW